MVIVVALSQQTMSSTQCCIPTEKHVAVTWHHQAGVLANNTGGEGGQDGGIGVAVWRNAVSVPVAGYVKTPRPLRRLWKLQKELTTAGEDNDIYQIESVGPLLALYNWPEIINNCLWVHFVDNMPAQYSFIKGSSSSLAGDVISGLTWEYIQRQRVWFWFERVDTKSNPTDKFSRGSKKGPWHRIEDMRFPPELCQKIVDEVQQVHAARGPDKSTQHA